MVLKKKACNGMRTGGREVRRRRVKTDLQRCHLKNRTTVNRTINQWTGQTKPSIHQHNVHKHYKKQFRTRTWGGQRVKYTTCNWWNWNQVCGRTRQNKWKMSDGSAMARRPVTSTAERRPNKERDRIRRKLWQCDFSNKYWTERNCTVLWERERDPTKSWEN